METTAVTLPHGFARDGDWHRAARLRPLCGNDEAFLCEEAANSSPAARTTALLARCLTELGPISDVRPEHARSLTIGDREALLLHLRRSTFGERLSCVLSCPNPDCGEKMDLDLNIGDLLSVPYAAPQALHETDLEADGTSCKVRFRLPCGEDAERVAEIARQDISAAAHHLVERCVLEARREDAPLDTLPTSAFRELPVLMAELDPQADMNLRLQCPACSNPFTTVFDAADFMYREVAAQRGGLYREVHLLAFHYHWSEADILAMRPAKRRMYLGLLSETLGGLGVSHFALNLARRAAGLSPGVPVLPVTHPHFGAADVTASEPALGNGPSTPDSTRVLSPPADASDASQSATATHRNLPAAPEGRPSAAQQTAISTPLGSIHPTGAEPPSTDALHAIVHDQHDTIAVATALPTSLSSSQEHTESLRMAAPPAPRSQASMEMLLSSIRSAPQTGPSRAGSTDPPRVHVRIGRVEVRNPQPSVVERPTAPRPPGGFDAYAGLRTYQRRVW